VWVSNTTVHDFVYLAFAVTVSPISLSCTNQNRSSTIPSLRYDYCVIVEQPQESRSTESS